MKKSPKKGLQQFETNKIDSQKLSTVKGGEDGGIVIVDMIAF